MTGVQTCALPISVAYIAERSDPAKIAIRTGRLELIGAAQESDPALRILEQVCKDSPACNMWFFFRSLCPVTGANSRRALEIMCAAPSTPFLLPNLYKYIYLK